MMTRGKNPIVGHILIISLLVFCVFAGVFVLYTSARTDREQINLYNDLAYRSGILAENVSDRFIEAHADQDAIRILILRLVSYEKIIDASYFDGQGKLVSSAQNPSWASRGIDAPTEVFAAPFLQPKVEIEAGYARYTYPLFEMQGSTSTVGYLSFAQDTQFIDAYIFRIWRDRTVIFLFLSLGLFAFAYLLFYIYVQRATLLAVDVLRRIRKSVDGTVEIPRDVFPFSRALTAEVNFTIQSFLRARQSAREEAELRYKIIDSPWTFSRLQRFFSARTSGRKIVNVTNREPYAHMERSGKTEVVLPAHGLISSLDEMMRACGGTWIAHGAGNRDRSVVSDEGKIMVPIEEPAYTLRRVFLEPDDVRGHYAGFSNEALYPLCLMTHNRPIFRDADWQKYQKVNQIFADAVIDEIAHDTAPIIFVHDLHFALLPRMIKAQRPDAEIIVFWHHPWPSAEQFSILPWKREILEGLLASDLLSFHVRHFCNNFMESVKKELEAKIDNENSSVWFEGRETLVKAFPMSTPFTNLHAKITQDPERVRQIVGADLESYRVILGVDRMDYTKGFMEKLKGVEQYYDEHPEMRKKTIFLQIAAPSREVIPKYQQYAQQVHEEVNRINTKLQTNTWKPIVLIHEQVNHDDLVFLYRKAEICLVTSLHDGMNLVAKEYVAQHKDDGVLILSEFTGAARELDSALIVNPYAMGQIAHAIHEAFEMEKGERKERLETMRRKIAQYNVFRWVADIFDALLNKPYYEDSREFTR